MNFLLRIALLASFVLAFSIIAASAQTRVEFRHGSHSKIVKGELNSPRTERKYVIRVRAGQTLKVDQTKNSNAVTIYIQDPGGEDVSDMEANCNSRKSVSPTVKGDYIVTVVQCTKVDRWRGTFRVKFTVL